MVRIYGSPSQISHLLFRKQAPIGESSSGSELHLLCYCNMGATVAPGYANLDLVHLKHLHICNNNPFSDQLLLCRRYCDCFVLF